MIADFFKGGVTENVPCTVEVEHSFDSLHAFVELDGIEIKPGDEVLVHGDPFDVPYGERIVVRRTASVKHASGAERMWTKLTGDAEFMELLEFSFSTGAKL